MITINFIAADSEPTRAEGKIGQSVMEVAVAAGISGIAADCGGMLTCATCHVMVDPRFAALLPAADGEELAMLAFTATPATPASRLSCQIILSAALDGLTVELPASQY
ncbi:MAG: ferredoxin [Polaromonas sp.]|uniref:2Fe-2S iron-sulfur cluster-binding protein n=1 Tax=Polaromonas sp. TaxID=1869339 RepID=UPI0040371BAD|nr:ferredoxin [Polaromonas sp.]